MAKYLAILETAEGPCNAWTELGFAQRGVPAKVRLRGVAWSRRGRALEPSHGSRLIGGEDLARVKGRGAFVPQDSRDHTDHRPVLAPAWRGSCRPARVGG